MKTNLLLLFSLFFCITGSAQFGPQQIISDTSPFPSKSIPLDIDNDGFIDVVSYGSGNILWFKNEDGLGNFSNPLLLANGIVALEAMYFYDLNSDGLLDIIYRTTNDKIAWLENIDGLGTFGVENILFQGSYCFSFSVADIDGDGDNDVFANLYASGEANRISWFENTDGLGDFSDEFLIEEGEFSGSGGGSILLNFDLDSDGDFDVITSYEGHQSSKLIWYENLDGLGNLSSSQELYQFQYNPLSDFSSIASLGYADINSDGRLDIIASTFFEDWEFHNYDIVWLENIDGQGLFDSPQNIDNSHTYSMSFYDLDNDGDIDILNARINISWFKNLDGLGTFSDELTISTEVEILRDTKAADFNGDGFLDIVSASSGDNKIAWYENLGTIGIEDHSQNIFSIYPNPTNGNLTITSDQNIKKIEVYNLIGQKVSEIKEASEINISSFPSGIYLLKIVNDSGNLEIHKIIKE